jgi:hypothetical protein
MSTARIQSTGDDLTIETGSIPMLVPFSGLRKIAIITIVPTSSRTADPTRKHRPARILFRKIMLEQ